jgi:hypothetical protein
MKNLKARETGMLSSRLDSSFSAVESWTSGFEVVVVSQSGQDVFHLTLTMILFNGVQWIPRLVDFE